MSLFLKQMINNKVKTITDKELMHYAAEYGFQLTLTESRKIIAYLQDENLDLFSRRQVEQFHQEIARITDKQTADNAQALFENMIRTYGLEHLFH